MLTIESIGYFNKAKKPMSRHSTRPSFVHIDAKMTESVYYTEN